jgi:amino acid transporter
MRSELFGYVAVSAGMALAASCYAMLGGLLGASSVQWVVLAIAIAGVLCAFVSASVGELAAMFPSAPGIRTYLRAAFGNYSSLAILFLYLAMVALAAGVEGTVVTTVLASVAPGIPREAVVFGLFLFVIATNIFGLELPRTLQLAMTGLLVLATLVVGISALWAEPSFWRQAHELPAAGSPGALDLVASVGTAVFLFMGFEWVTPLGRGPKSYQRLIPLSMLLAIVSLVVVYGIFAAGMGRQLMPGDLAGNPIPQITLGAALYGGAGRYVLAAVSLLAMLTSFNAGLMGASRLLYGLAREGVAPAWVAHISLRTGVPINAVAAVGLLSLSLALIVMHTGTYRYTGVTVAAIECLVYGALMLAVLRLRRTRATASRPFRTPLPQSVQWLVAAAFPLLAVCALSSLPEAGFWPVAFLATLTILAASLALLCVNRIPKRTPSILKQGATP